MIELLVFGLLLGWGAAIPIGAINLEIIRRNLRFSTSSGLAFGLGACIADVTYLLVLSYGALQFINYPVFLKSIGIIGSLILAWFGWTALRQKVETTEGVQALPVSSFSVARHARDGYFLTLINPYSIVFWSSVSMTISANTKADNATFYAGIGVLLGVLSWVLTLNTILHLTRHRMSSKIMHYINITGGFILIGLAILGFWRSL